MTSDNTVSGSGRFFHELDAEVARLSAAISESQAEVNRLRERESYWITHYKGAISCLHDRSAEPRREVGK